VGLLELFNADMGVDLRATQRGVAEHLLDVANVGSVFEHERGHGVAEDMGRSFFMNVGPVDVASDEFADGPGRYLFSVFG